MNRKDVLVVCAIVQETQGQLENYKTLYTGVGKVNATYKLTKYLDTHVSKARPKFIINYGTAGSRELPIGELVDCTKFIQRDMNVTSLGFMQGQTPFEDLVPTVLDYDHVEFNPISKKLRCGTGDNFVDNNIDSYSDESDWSDWVNNNIGHGTGMASIAVGNPPDDIPDYIRNFK